MNKTLTNAEFGAFYNVLNSCDTDKFKANAKFRIAKTKNLRKLKDDYLDIAKEVRAMLKPLTEKKDELDKEYKMEDGKAMRHLPISPFFSLELFETEDKKAKEYIDKVVDLVDKEFKELLEKLDTEILNAEEEFEIHVVCEDDWPEIPDDQNFHLIHMLKD